MDPESETWLIIQITRQKTIRVDGDGCPLQVACPDSSVSPTLKTSSRRVGQEE